PAVTMEMKSNFLRAARTDLSCKAEVMTAGRRILYGTATITDSEGKIVSHHTLTYINA
ncbi:PaaI family thioesterase, partial [Pseudomonas sp. MWU12-2115]